MPSLKEQYNNLFDYNAWAWQRVFPSVTKLSNAHYMLDRGFFWGSIHGMLVHALSAEFTWLQRLYGHSPDALFDPADYADFGAVQAHWQVVNADLLAYVSQLTSDRLNQTVTYHTTSGKRHETAIADILHHLANHSTEHRSQLTPVLYRLNVPTQPLDYIFYVRERVASNQ